jgi:uncharacterized damage-inducible protein DinB
MSLAQAVIDEFEAELPVTRKTLERLPDYRLEWRPHPRSMTAGQLALHMATFPGQVVLLAEHDEAPAPQFGASNPQPATQGEIMAALDESAATVRRVLSTFDDAKMRATWKLMAEDRAVMSIPRTQFLRNILLNHWYHHRGQLTVYLREVGATVPSIYGPSADELPAFLRVR